jgi:hypothetical protein
VIAIVVISLSGSAPVGNERGLTDSGAAGTGSPSAPSPSTATAARASAPEKCKHARKAVVFYRGKFHSHRTRMGAGSQQREISYPRAACSQVRFLAFMWRSRAYVARVSADAILFFRKMREKTLKDFRVTPGNSAWRRAVQEAQRAYPGTDSWLLSCSASEGGWGRWVPNSQGSGVGGWMQMYPSTFWRMWATAKADVTSRGFKVPASAASWYSPLGQALASAWGLTNGRRGEWAGHGC